MSWSGIGEEWKEARQKGEEVREDEGTEEDIRADGKEEGGEDGGRQMEEEGREGVNMEMAKVI